MTFDHISENILQERNRFLKFPRFLQMVINHQAPELRKEGLTVIALSKMTDATLAKMSVYRKGDDGILNKPVEKDLICHLKNPSYRCPPEKRWRNDGSDSEREDLGIVAVDEENVIEVVEAVQPVVDASEAGGALIQTAGTSEKIRVKSKGKRKRKKADVDVDADVEVDDEDDLMDVEDYLEMMKRKAFKRVVVASGPGSGSGQSQQAQTESRPTPPVQPNPQQAQEPQPSTAAIVSTASGAATEMSDLQVDVRFLKTNYMDVVARLSDSEKRHRAFEKEVSNHVNRLLGMIKGEQDRRQAIEERYADLSKEVGLLKEDNQMLKAENAGLKGYSQMLLGKIKEKKKLRITEGDKEDGGDDEEEEEDDDEEDNDGDDSEATASENEG